MHLTSAERSAALFAEPEPAFTPVPIRPRRDGWTAARQHGFIAALAESGDVAQAARAVGLSTRSAYTLRTHPQGQAFARAWDAALMTAGHRLLAAAFERALTGTPRPIVRGGQVIGEHVAPSDRMLMFLLRHLSPEMFGYAGPAPRRAATIAAQQGSYADALGLLTDADVEVEPAGEAAAENEKHTPTP